MDYLVVGWFLLTVPKETTWGFRLTLRINFPPGHRVPLSRCVGPNALAVECWPIWFSASAARRTFPITGLLLLGRSQKKQKQKCAGHRQDA